jgi:hypothetical protein
MWIDLLDITLELIIMAVQRPQKRIIKAKVINIVPTRASNLYTAYFDIFSA